MRRRDKAIRRRLREMRIPEHGPGFWGAVERALDQHADEDSPAEVATVVPLDGRADRDRFAPWMAAVAGAAVVLAFGAVTALVFRSGVGDEVAATTSMPTTPTSSTASTTLPVTTSTAIAVDALSPSPWSAAPVLQAEVPKALTIAWEESENHEWCSALTPTDLGDATEQAVPRTALFDGGWGVAWDLPDGPGQTVLGEDCPDCGRSAFGLAGTGEVQTASTGRSRPSTIAWSDGSIAGYGSDTDAPSSSRSVAEVVVDGQGCVYEVWSNLGDAHLVRLIQGLRLVEGMTAAPVDLRRPGDQQTVVQRGLPPWSGKTIPLLDIDPLVVDQWDALGVVAPQLALAELGSELDGTALRTWDGGVAWDAADGAGHDADNEPCADCGRGVVGLGWRRAGEPTTVDGVSVPYRIEWSDGSFAEYGGRLSNPAIPRNRVVFFDAETGTETADALQAIVHAEGMDHDVIVWTHLGEDHLLFLIDQLRLVGSR